MAALAKCLYEVLSVKRNATIDDIKKAYKKLALQNHPDKNLDRTMEAKTEFQALHQAYKTLSNPQEKAKYDRRRTAKQKAQDTKPSSNGAPPTTPEGNRNRRSSGSGFCSDDSDSDYYYSDDCDSDDCDSDDFYWYDWDFDDWDLDYCDLDDCDSDDSDSDDFYWYDWDFDDWDLDYCDLDDCDSDDSDSDDCDSDDCDSDDYDSDDCDSDDCDSDDRDSDDCDSNESDSNNNYRHDSKSNDSNSNDSDTNDSDSNDSDSDDSDSNDSDSYDSPPAAKKPKMESTYIPTGAIKAIKDLNLDTNRVTIRARVTNKYDVINWPNSNEEGTFFKMDLLDDSGGIRLIGFNTSANSFYDRIKVSDVYYISQFTVKPANKQYTSIKHDYELSFDDDTQIVPCVEDTSDIPHFQGWAF